jgi:hypothetical protein
MSKESRDKEKLIIKIFGIIRMKSMKLLLMRNQQSNRVGKEIPTKIQYF